MVTMSISIVRSLLESVLLSGDGVPCNLMAVLHDMVSVVMCCDFFHSDHAAVRSQIYTP